jgi:NADH-quinone oxidoreductase subunit J
MWGVLVTGAVFTALAWAVKHSFASQRELSVSPEATVKKVGDALMTKYVLPLEVVGLLLTAALIGAVIIAMRDVEEKAKTEGGESKMVKPSAPSSPGGHP